MPFGWRIYLHPKITLCKTIGHKVRACKTSFPLGSGNFVVKPLNIHLRPVLPVLSWTDGHTAPSKKSRRRCFLQMQFFHLQHCLIALYCLYRHI